MFILLEKEYLISGSIAHLFIRHIYRVYEWICSFPSLTLKLQSRENKKIGEQFVSPQLRGK